MLSLPGVNVGQARAWLEASALDLDPPGWDIFTGSGLIQLNASLLLAILSCTPTLDTATSSMRTPPSGACLSVPRSGRDSTTLIGTAAGAFPSASPLVQKYHFIVYLLTGYRQVREKWIKWPQWI